MKTMTQIPMMMTCQADDCLISLNGRRGKKYCSRRCSLRTTYLQMTPEERSERARKSNRCRTPEQKRREGRIAGLASAAKYSPEERSQKARHAAMSLTPEQRSERSRKGAIAVNSRMTPEERSERTRRINANLTLEQLEAKRKRSAKIMAEYNSSLTPEERSNRSAKAQRVGYKKWLAAHSSKTPEGRKWREDMLQSFEDEIQRLEKVILEQGNLPEEVR